MRDRDYVRARLEWLLRFLDGAEDTAKSLTDDYVERHPEVERAACEASSYETTCKIATDEVRSILEGLNNGDIRGN